MKKARDALLANGIHPSIDAVRVALGNTGSKTTIHKYLKELAAEDGEPSGLKVSIGEALQDLVERLAAQLYQEADIRIAAVNAQRHAESQAQTAKLEAAQDELASQREKLRELAEALECEQLLRVRANTSLQAEAIARHTAEQQVADFKERMLENDAHLRSLEEKHAHAREALEHYRQSIKQQRDQDQRRHEQQVQQLQAEIRQSRQEQVVQRGEITRLNQEGAKLVGDLSHAKHALYDTQSAGRAQAIRIEQLQAVEARFTEHAAKLQATHERLALAEKLVVELTAELGSRELSLATAQATLAVQQGITAEIRAFLSPST